MSGTPPGPPATRWRPRGPRTDGQIRQAAKVINFGVTMYGWGFVRAVAEAVENGPRAPLRRRRR